MQATAAEAPCVPAALNPSHDSNDTIPPMDFETQRSANDTNELLRSRSIADAETPAQEYKPGLAVSTSGAS
jgi:hypothetical protein